MVRLAMNRIDLNERYGVGFQGGHDAQIRNIDTRQLGKSTHHCPDCKGVATKSCFWNLHLAYCDVCGERFSVWSLGCSMHPYKHNANILFKAVRDNWPEHKIAEIERLERLEADTRAADEEDEDMFPDVVPPFIERIPHPKDDHRYGPLNCGNKAQLMVEQSIGQLAVDGVPGALRGKAAKEAKRARATKFRIAQMKSAEEASADCA